jgi:arylsulfatase A-like enzyme
MADKPNLIILLADQFRYDCLGCAGSRGISTPNLDALAAGGAR